MPPQPHPPVAEGAWLRPRPARQSRDCRRGRVHRQSFRRPKRVRLKAAAFPAQHIRSALSQNEAGGAAHRRLRRIPAGRRVRMRRGLPSPGSVGIPPIAGSAASRLPPSASPAVTASASCRRPSGPLRSFLALMTMRVAITKRSAYFAQSKARGRAPQKRTCATSAPADARRERGRSALGRRDARIAAQGRQAATGGIPTEPDAAHGRMRRAPLAARASGGGVTAARTRPRARANRGGERPRSGTQQCEMRRTGKRPPPNAI